jgi:hypothetical protein
VPDYPQGVAMTNEQMHALEAVRAAIFAAESTGLSKKEICEAAVAGLDYAEPKGGRSPINYNPLAPDLHKPNLQGHHKH